jgi:Ras-related protein Rab-8A
MTYQAEGCDVDGIIKILIIGNSSVGKSCVLARYSEGDFETSSKSTIGIDFKIRQLEVNGRIVKLQIWDTAGQERFRTITRAHYRGAMGVLIMYDVTDEKSFRDINTWYESVEENTTKNTLIALCANKCDVKEESTGLGTISKRATSTDVDETEQQGEEDNIPRRVVSTERGRALASEYAVPYFETSAKNELGVDELFLEISKLCLKQSKVQNRERHQEAVRLKKNHRRKDGQSQGSCC